ncbi:Ig-like domain-containing protein [Pyxidicoccus xibeiensis]|uniref:Ig-like domain-containing protein n=1 Tax=Pyxidicoccus xibeiensis TaxID=2906759 RepID=UPI0020A82075|nr:Ig-like domain-containing protein [Pyxidicoccus xibeiensis]MCP3139760.1 Ig-like domain-containing protein [Pyxidicoccus xibeiensis]
MRLVHATALLATCAILALTGCNDDSPDTPDAGTQPDAGDTAPPTVTGTTPAADEAHVAATAAITVRFSEPMKSGAGTVRVAVDGASRALGSGTWQANAFTVQPVEALPPGARVQVTVETDFEDAAGNRLASPLTFHFNVHGTAAPRPHVTASTPAEGATSVLPVELYKEGEQSLALRKVVTLTFSEPMDPTAAQVTLTDVTTPANAPRALTGTWSQDSLTLTVAIPRPESDLPPLEQENRYSLDVTGLKSATGQPVSTTHAGLGDGKLDFTTGRRSADVEHACTHALVNPTVDVTAGSAPTGSMPATDSGHAYYRLTLPANGASFQGYTEVVTFPDEDQTVALYLNQSVDVAVHDTTEGEELLASTREPAAPVCLPAITHVVKFPAPAGDRFLRLTFGPTPHQVLTFVFERY